MVNAGAFAEKSKNTCLYPCGFVSIRGRTEGLQLKRVRVSTAKESFRKRMPPVGYSQNRRQLVQPLISITTMSVPVTAVVTIPVRVSPAIIVPMAMMPWGNDHHVGRVKHRRAHDQRRRVVRPRCHNDCRGTHRSRGNEHGRRADGRDGRADHARRRWEAEGEGEVEFRPRRGGDCEPESEGTDSDYGFGFHNGRIDEGRPGRFEKCPLIELIGASAGRNSEGRRLPSGNCGAADRSV